MLRHVWDEPSFSRAALAWNAPFQDQVRVALTFYHKTN